MNPATIAKNRVCGWRRNRRILKYDNSGRIFLLPRRGKPVLGERMLSVLSNLAVGESANLVALDLPESVQNHLMHMGFVPNARITFLRRAPAGDPLVYAIDGMEVALRRETVAAIRVRPVEEPAVEDRPAAKAAEVAG